MTKTKKKKQTEKLYCPYCGRMAVLRPAKHVYGSRNLDSGNYLVNFQKKFHLNKIKRMKNWKKSRFSAGFACRRPGYKV